VRASSWRMVVFLSLGIYAGCLSDSSGVRRTNTLIVHTETTGSNLPPTFGIEVGGFPLLQIEPNDSFFFDAIPVGPVSVELFVSLNCQVNPENPRAVQIVPEERTQTTFTVVCS